MAQPLYSRIFHLVVAPIIIILSILGLVLISLFGQKILATEVDRIFLLMHKVADSTFEAIFFGNTAYIERTVKKVLTSSSDITYLFIANKDDKIVVSSDGGFYRKSLYEIKPKSIAVMDKQWVKELPSWIFGEKIIITISDKKYPDNRKGDFIQGWLGVYEAETKLDFEGQHIGTIIVAFDKKVIFYKIFSLALVLFLIGTLIVFALGLSIYLLSLRIVQPIKELADQLVTIQNIPDGDQANSQNLVRSIRFMSLNNIKASFQELDTLVSASRNFCHLIADLFSNISSLEQHKASAFMAQCIAHDLRVPLSVFEGILLAPDQEQLKSHRSDIQLALARIYRMLQSIKKGNYKQSIDSREWFLDLTYLKKIFNDRCEQNKIHLIFEFSSPLMPLLMESTQIERVIANLLENAIYAAQTTISVEIFFNNEDLHIIVIDDGEGIPPDFLPRLFMKNETFNKQGGTGLGLYFCRECVRSYQGEIFYKRENGKTYFVSIIPHARRTVLSEDFYKEELDEEPSKKANTIYLRLSNPELELAVCNFLKKLPAQVYIRFDAVEDAELVISDNEDQILSFLEQGLKGLYIDSSASQTMIFHRITLWLTSI